jgi:cell division protein FtsB
MSEKKMVSRSVAIALGIVCILLIASLGGAIAYYRMKVNDGNNQITSDTNTINQLNATIAEQSNTIASLNANITNLTNEENQLKAWLDGNETLLNQTQTWLNGNITSYETQISSLNAQITQLQTWLSGNFSAYIYEVSQVNYLNEVLYNLSHFVNPVVWVNDQTVSQPAGGLGISYTTWWGNIVDYAGYVSINVSSSTTNSTYANVVYSAYGVSYNNPISVGTSGTAYFPVLPSQNITVEVGNGNLVGGATETVTITYYY